MAVESRRGLSRARKIYVNRPQRVRELREQGKKVLGYVCIFPILEMMTALDVIPYRLFGDMREPITRADSFLTTTSCPFLRSLLDVGLKGRYDFLDGIVMAHICDVGANLASIWRASVQPQYSHYIDIPHTTRETAQKQMKELLKDFQESLESFTGKKLTPERLEEAIAVHNQQRALVRELYDLRKADPPLISGVETLQVLKAIMSLPVEEGNSLLREVIDEVRERNDGPLRKAARLLIWGSIIDDTALVEMIENLEANVVMDDTCVGSRAYFDDVKLTDDRLDGLARRYLMELKCPRTFREDVLGDDRKDYAASLQGRYAYLGEYARDWKVTGVVLEGIRYCDTHGYEVPSVKDYLANIGLPSIYVEHDYSEGALAPIKTRVQGFLEIIGTDDVRGDDLSRRGRDKQIS